MRGLLQNGQDQAKIIVKQEDFDRVLEPYLNKIPEAQKYKEQMQTFVDTALTRNQKIYEYNALLVKKDDLLAEIDRRNQDITSLTRSQMKTNNPMLAKYKVLMSNMYAQCKRDIVKTLYLEQRAWEYWALEKRRWTFVDEDIAALESLHAKLIASELHKREERTRDSQSVELVLTISKNEYRQAFDEFQKKGKLVFSFSPNDPRFMDLKELFVSRVEVEIPKIGTSANQLMIELTHNGKATVKDMRGEIVEFSHLPRPTTIIYQLNSNGARTGSGPNLGGKIGEYAFLSPFAVWTLFVNPAFHADLNLDLVTEVRLKFDAHFLRS